MRKVLLALLICLVLIIAACGNRQPKLTSSQMEWKTYHRNVATDDPKYPLEVIEDGYKMIRAYRSEARKISGTEYPAKNYVEWGWKFIVKNKSKDNLNVTVEYILKDKDSFVVTYSSETVYVKAGKTETIQETAIMNYENIKRVADCGWKISYRSSFY